MTYTFNAVPSKNGRGRHRKPTVNVGKLTAVSTVAMFTATGTQVAHAHSSLGNFGAAVQDINESLSDVNWEKAAVDAIYMADTVTDAPEPEPETESVLYLELVEETPKPQPEPEPEQTPVTVTGQVYRPAEGTFTSGFGPRWGRMHNGIDIANAEGTPIRAAMAGTVIDSGPASGFGNWIRIKHDDGSMTVYGHMSTLNVKVGDRVEAGQVIAGMGNLGWSTGPHLHFEYHPTGNGAVDPVPWFRSHGIEF